MAKRARGEGREVDEWLGTLDELLDESFDRETKVQLQLDDLAVEVPVAFDEDAARAEWRFDGGLAVEIDGVRASLAEWFQLHEETPPEPSADRDLGD